MLPACGLALWLRPFEPFAVDVALLYFALGAQSLAEHAEAVAKPLREGRLDEARQRVGWIVSRETSGLDESGVAKAGVESVLENGNDAIFGTLFWFALLGGFFAKPRPFLAGDFVTTDAGTGLVHMLSLIHI